MTAKTQTGKQMEKTGKPLNEALQDIKKLVWPSLGIEDVIRFMKFSPAWHPQLERTEIETELTDEQRAETVAALDAFYKELLGREDFNAEHDRDPIISIKAAKAPQKNKQPPVGGVLRLSGEKTIIDKFTEAAAAAQLSKIINRTSDTELTVKGVEAQQKKAFSLFNAMKKEDVANDILAAARNAMQLYQNMKSAAPDAKAEIEKQVKTAGNALKALLQSSARVNLTPDEQAEFDKAVTRNSNARPAAENGSNNGKCVISGYFGPVCMAYAIAHRIVSDVSNEDIRMWMSMYNGNTALNEPTITAPSHGFVQAMLPPPERDVFVSNARLIGEADEQTRWIVKICNDEIARSAPAAREALRKNIDFEERKLRGDLSQEERAKSEQALAGYRRDLGKRVFNGADELDAYMRQKGIGFLTRYYNKQLAMGRKKIKDTTDAIAYREEQKKKLAKAEKLLPNAKDDREKLEIRTAIKRAREEIQQLTGIIPSDADGNTSYDEEAEQKKLPADLMQFKTLDALEGRVEQFIKDSSGEDVTKFAQTDPDPKTSCARRRMKLFAAAERRGAIVYKCSDWVVAALPTAKAAQPFGRYRPKVDASGKIIDACNLEDWEGITPENKKLRDSLSGAYVKDGMYSGSYETVWCTSGWGYEKRRQWGNEMGPGNMFDTYSKLGALIAFMDCSTGYLYQYGNGSLLDECDHSGGILKDASGSMRKLMIKYPSLQRAITAAGFMKYIKTDDQPKTQSAMLGQLMQSGMMTPSGSILINGYKDFETVLPIIDFIDELKIAPGCSADSVFDAARMSTKPVGLPAIDLGGVKRANDMFKNLTISNEVLQLKNTGEIEDATRMFNNLKFQSPNAEIAGLDTKSVKYANEMFALCRNTQFRGVRIPDLDFRRCVTMNNAFTSSGIMGISFKGEADRVISAIDTFKNCFMLETMPNVLFKSIRHGRRLASNFDGDYSVIFDGCQKMVQKYRSQQAGNGKPGDKFDDRIEDIKAFYEDTSRVQPALDSRGYVVVKDSSDAEAAAPILARREVKGIVIDKNAQSRGLFNGLKLRIKSLDLNGRSDTRYMFMNCEITEFGEVIGSENVTVADNMFADTTCSIYPTIRFPKCTKMKTFDGAAVPDDVPNIQYAPIVEEIRGAEMDVVADGIPPNVAGDNIAYAINQYLFGSEHSEWAAKHGSRRVAEIMYVQPLQATAEDALEKMPKDERGYVVVNEHMTQNTLKTLIKSKPAGFVIDSETVANLNRGGRGIAVFEGIKTDIMPVIDLNGLQCCAGMFKNCDVGQFEGFENFSSVVNASLMFYYARVRAAMPKLDTQNVQNAQDMFKNARLTGGFSEKLDLRNVQNAKQMFENCFSSNFPLGNEVNLPNAVDVNGMFYAMNVNQAGSLNKVAAPLCANAGSMFSQVNWLVNVKSVEIGENADTSAGGVGSMFMGCSRLETVGNVTAPRATSSWSMFMNCGALKRVGVVNMPRVVNMGQMFKSDSSLLNVCQFFVPSTADGTDMFDGTQLGLRVYGKDGKVLFARMRLLGR